MATLPITVNYVSDGDDFSITATAGKRTSTARAPGLIAARERAEQLVEEMVDGESGRAVVHLLDGDALAFTTAYLHARHGLSQTG
ncbi:MAG TPA: hypothetical protein VGP03_14850 [Pseudonocardiaceae bacterium]|jgi:hypothetical protein|nr:hypothetical protein [Pseudonocardiaceae bacterium]